MENVINKRIKLLIKSLHLTNKAFCLNIGIPESTMKSIFLRNTPPKIEIIEKISAKYPEYSLNWLIMGMGDMKINSNKPSNNAFEGGVVMHQSEIKGNKNITGGKNNVYTNPSKDFLMAEIERLNKIIETQEKLIKTQEKLLEK